MNDSTKSPSVPQALRTSLPQGLDLVMRVMPMPADANGNGDIFGGWIMAQVDLAGAVLPARIAKGRMATVAVNEFIFKQPITDAFVRHHGALGGFVRIWRTDPAVSVADLLSFYARVTRVGNTSISVHVEVYAERNPADLHVVKVTEANLTYVAIDSDGKPRQIPKA